MASEITLKYLHPSIKTYITTENYKYDTSVKREVLFVADVFDHGKDNVLQEVNTLSEYLFKYGTPNLKKFGQAGYNIERWLTNGGSAVIMRLLPEDASYAHAVLNIQYKNATNGKTVVAANGDETKINDIYLRPVVAYIGVNNTSEQLLESELAEDRSDYPTTDGYIDNFIFAVYPEGRGEYYNDLGFRIRLNPSYDGVLTSRVYTFEVIKYSSASTYDIIDGPYFVTFDPDAIDPNSQKSMFIESVVNSYSDYIKVKFNTDNYIKLASIINDEVDPYIVDVISGQSRILPNGERETYFSSVTGKDEDVHVSLRKYSTTGVALKNDGEFILNIANNDETTSDIVDIADNSRRVIYNNQKFVTDYMRGYYNWLMQGKVDENLKKVIAIATQSSYDGSPAAGLLLNKVENLIFANHINSEPYNYTFGHSMFDSLYVGSAPEDGQEPENDSWYLRTQEIVNPGLKDKNGDYVGTDADHTGYEGVDENYTSTGALIKTITPDGYIEATNENLISFYHNFMKYMEFVANYDVYNNTGFVLSKPYIEADLYFDDMTSSSPLYSLIGTSAAKEYTNIYQKNGENITAITKGEFEGLNKYTSIFDFIINNILFEATDTSLTEYTPVGKSGATATNCFDKFASADLTVESESFEAPATSLTTPVFIDDSYEKDIYIPIVDFTTYNADGTLNIFGDYLKVRNFVGDEILTPIKGVSVNIGGIESDNTLTPIIEDSFSRNVFYKGTCGWTNLTEVLIFDRTKESETGLMPADFSKADHKRIPISVGDVSSDSMFTTDFYYYIFEEIYNHFENNNFSDYVIYMRTTGTGSSTNINQTIENDVKNYTYGMMTTNKDALARRGYVSFNLSNLIKFYHEAYIDNFMNVYSDDDVSGYYIPDTTKKGMMINIPLTTFKLRYKKVGNDYLTKNVSELINILYFKSDTTPKSDIPVFNEVFEERLRNGLLSQSFNKAASYATLISKELDGKGKDTIIEDITNAKTASDLDYSKYSLTTIFNLYVGGFESLVNNMGSVTDYSNYSSLKYLIKTVNNNLDLRTTYLTLLNVHRNNILDLSTKLAKQNASVILGEETLDSLYTAMDEIVVETNYLINIINTILNKHYTIYDLETMKKASDGKPYAYYFSTNASRRYKTVDPLGIDLNISKYGTKNDTTQYSGILPLLEKIIINITGENHLGEERDTIYGGPNLISLYDDIKNGYLLGGLTQERYETIYRILSESLSNLSDIHSIINVFVNEKYITDIVNTLIGTIDIDNTVIKYNGSSYSVNAIWELYNSGEDENLTQIMVINLINDALDVDFNTQPLPINFLEANVSPVIQFPAYCQDDILNSLNIALENKKIIQNNIAKQDRVLASLNTLCYDNLVTDISAPLSLMEGSDGSFTYDDSTAAALKARQHRINDIRIKAYKGTWNEDVINKDLFEFDHVLDANYEDPVKNAIITLARDERQDFFYWADTKIQNTVQDAIDWKTGFTNQTYFMSIISQSQVWYDEYTSRNINLTSTYLVADMLCRHIDSYGIQYPMAGSRRGVVGGFISNDWYPNEEQKEKLYKNKINYLEKDITTIRIGAQNTNYPTGPLGQINNMLVLLRVKRTVEKIAKTYQFEFNTADTRSAMAAEINVYLGNWINNGACTVATATVYASDYDIIQKIVRVDVTLQFTGVIERIVINIDCPASI